MKQKEFSSARRRFCGAAAAGMATGTLAADAALFGRKSSGKTKKEEGIKLVISHVSYPQVTLEMLRGMEICRNSPSASIKMCVGTWGEMAGPEGRGEDVVAAVRYFGKAGKITGVHFRNVSGPLPRFVETFMDNGYLDMYQVMKALVEVDFQGILAPDHVPAFTDEKRLGPMGVSGTPYSIGYIRALLQAAKAEL